MEKKNILLIIILCLVLILTMGCKSGIGDITGSVTTYGKIAGNDAKENITPEEIAAEQNEESGQNIITSSIAISK